MKNALEGINSRITEAEGWIVELDHGMTGITAKKQNREKRMKKLRTLSEACGTIVNAQIFELEGTQKKSKRKSTRKYLRGLPP